MHVAWERFEGILQSFLKALPEIGIALVVVLVGYGIGRLIEAGVTGIMTRRRRSRSVVRALGRLTRWIVLLLGFLIGLTIVFPSFKPADLIELLGIWSVAIGFAFRDILQNFLSGILLLVTQPFREEDQIVAGQFEGTVEEIQARATMIKTYDGRRVVVPNAVLFTQPVTVNTAFEVRRVEAEVSIGYGDDIATAKKTILEAVVKTEGVLPHPATEVLTWSFGESGIVLQAWFWTPSRRLDLLQVRDRVLANIREALKAKGVDIPFPTHQVLFHDQTEETDGDRARQREGWPPERRA